MKKTSVPMVRRLAAASLVIPGVALAYLATPPMARLDDGYIAVHSARVILSGTDPIFNAPALTGATSPAYVALLIVILRAGVSSADTALRLANALGLTACAAAAWYLGGTLALSAIRRAALVVVAIGSGIILVVNLTNGLETGWAIATLTFAIASARAGRPLAASAAAGLLPFLRPDLTPGAIAVIAYALHGQPRRQQALGLAAAAAVALPWLVWMRVDTGEWITQTYRAKQLFYSEGCRPWIEKSATVVKYTAIALAQLFPLGLGIIPLARDRFGRLGIVAIVVSLAAYFVSWPGAVWHPFYRYQSTIMVPWLVLGSAIALARLPEIVAASVALAVVFTQIALPHDQNKQLSGEVQTAAAWIDTNLPPDATLLVHDAGGISEFAHHRAVDLVGLKTPSSIAAHARWTWPSCVADRGTALTAIARDSGASYYVALSGWDEYITPALRDGGFILTPVRPAPVRPGYTVYRMETSSHTQSASVPQK